MRSEKCCYCGRYLEPGQHCPRCKAQLIELRSQLVQGIPTLIEACLADKPDKEHDNDA